MCIISLCSVSQHGMKAVKNNIVATSSSFNLNKLCSLKAFKIFHKNEIEVQYKGEYINCYRKLISRGEIDVSINDILF